MPTYQRSFHELFREIIKKGDTTVYSLSRDSGVDRTVIQKALSGERALSDSAYQRLLPHLHLTPIELQQLHEARIIEQIGLPSFSRSQAVRELCINMSFLSDAALHKVSAASQPLSAYPVPFVSHQTLTTLGIIQSLMQELSAADSKPSIQLFSSFDAPFIAQLMQLFQNNTMPPVQIEHIIPFVRGTSQNMANVQNVTMLSYLLPFAFHNKANYTVSYYYEDMPLSETQVPFPYYLLVNQHVLLFSKDYKASILLHAEAAACYADAFHQLQLYGKSLLYTFDSPFALLDEYNKFHHKEKAYSLDRQPCIIHVIDEDMPQKLIFDSCPFKSELIEMLLLRHRQSEAEHKAISTFSLSGLEDFCRDGIIYEYPLEISRPFLPAERRILLDRIIQLNESGNKLFLLLNEQYFSPCPAFTFYTDSALTLFTLASTSYKVCTIQEATVALAIQEFMENAVSQHYLFSPEKSNIAIKKAMELIV